MVLATGTYERDPFPQSEGGQAWNGMGNQYSTSGVVPDTKDVSLIIVYPPPQSMAIAMDNDVKHYGFYDYFAIDCGGG
jgi:hypothetical protein